MILTLTALIPPDDDSQFMSELSCSVEFKEPEGITLESAIKSNHNFKNKLQNHFNIEIDIEYDTNEVTLLLLSADDNTEVLDLFEDIRANLIKDLETHGFEAITFSTLFLDSKVSNEYQLPANNEYLN